MEKFSIRQAIINVCARMKPGDFLKVYDIEERVRFEMIKHGSHKKPMQESIQRQFRKDAGFVQVEYDKEKQIYVKLIPLPPLTAEEKEARQQNLFG